MSDLLTDLDLKTERATEPPKRWQNLWEVKSVCRQGDKEFLPGCVLRSEETWPSKEIAEQAALDHAPRMHPHAFYLRSVPADDGEAP